MPAIVIIPARYGSTRFPGKPLCHLFGKPMIRHVYERAVKAGLADAVYIATDNENIVSAVEDFGGNVIMTSAEHRSGTDRIAEAVSKLYENGALTEGMDDVIVNVQGDEPMIMPEMIDDVIRLMDDGRASICTLAKRIEAAEEIADPNVVKVVFDNEGFALYFSRAPIPYHRDATATAGARYFKHIGIYAYRKDVLRQFSQLSPTRLEETEKLEQLRALETGLKIKVQETQYETIGVDTASDLERVEKCLNLSL